MATRLWCLPWPLLCACTLASAALAQKPRLDDVAFGVASHSDTFCDRWEKYTSSWWRDNLNGVVLVDKMTPKVEECHKQFMKTFPSLKVADAPKPPPNFVDWAGAGGERIIWSQIHILRQHFPDKRWVSEPHSAECHVLSMPTPSPHSQALPHLQPGSWLNHRTGNTQGLVPS